MREEETETVVWRLWRNTWADSSRACYEMDATPDINHFLEMFSCRERLMETSAISKLRSVQMSPDSTHADGHQPGRKDS